MPIPRKDYLADLLREYTLVIVDSRGKILYYSKKGGIRPVVEAVLYEGEKIDKNIVADRVIGKAAAMVVANRRPLYVFGLIMSTHARDFLERRRISYGFGKIVDAIRTERGDLCPFERLVLGIDDPKEALEKIVENLGITKKS